MPSTMQRADFQTATWRRFIDGQHARLAELREQNDSQSADHIKTAAIRGQIAEVKRTIGLSPDSPNDELHPALRGASE